MRMYTCQIASLQRNAGLGLGNTLSFTIIKGSTKALAT